MGCKGRGRGHVNTGSADDDASALGPKKVLDQLPFTRKGIRVLFSRLTDPVILARQGPPFEQEVQKWEAVRKINWDGYPDELISKWDGEAPEPKDELWYTDEDIQAEIDRYMASGGQGLPAQPKPKIPTTTRFGFTVNAPSSSSALTPNLPNTNQPSFLPVRTAASPPAAAAAFPPPGPLKSPTTGLTMAELAEEIKVKDKKIEELEAQLTKSQEEKHALEGTNTRLLESVSAAQSRADDLRSSAISYEGKIQQYETDVRQKESEIGHREDQIKMRETDISALNDKIADLEGQLDATKNELRSERKSLSLHQDSSQREVGNLKDEASKRTEEIETLSRRLQNEQDKLHEERENHKTTREFLEEVRSTGKSLREQLAYKESRITELEHTGVTTKSLKEKHEKMINEHGDLQARISVLEQESEGQRQELEAMSSQLREKIDEHDEMRGENTNLRRKLDELEQDQSQADRDRSNFQSQVAMLQQQLLERSKESDNAFGAGLFTPPVSSPPPLKSNDSFNSLADELEGQSDEEEDEDSSLAETLQVVDLIENSTQTDPELLRHHVHTGVSTEPITITPIITPQVISTVLTKSYPPVHLELRQPIIPEPPTPAVEEPPKDDVIPEKLTAPLLAPSPSPIDRYAPMLRWTALALLSILFFISLSQVVEYYHFNSPAPSTPLRVLYAATSSPVRAVFNSVPTPHFLAAPVLAKAPLNRVGTHGVGSWLLGVWPIGWEESWADGGYWFGGWLMGFERWIGVDRSGLW